MNKKFKRLVDHVICKHADNIGISTLKDLAETESLTFKQIDRLILSITKQLSTYNLLPGDRVALCVPHSSQAFLTELTLAYVGVTAVMIDASLPNIDIEKLLSFSDVQLLITSQEIFEGLSQEIKQEQTIALLTEKYELLPICSPELSKEKHAIDPQSDVIAIIFSSGTTDLMKGICLTYQATLKSCQRNKWLCKISEDSSLLSVLPLNHIAGYVSNMTFFLSGAKLGFLQNPNPTLLHNALLQFQPTYFLIIPKVYELMEQKIRAEICDKGIIIEKSMDILLSLSGFLRKNFKINIGPKLFHKITDQVFGKNIFALGTGAAPCKKETVDFFTNLGYRWINYYATSETGIPAAATDVRWHYPTGTLGKADRYPDIHIKIGHPNEENIGEIMIKSAFMMKGYFRQPQLTKTAFEDGYFKTGDYGYIDKNGYLYITGRIKESILLSSGKKVSPIDVDSYYESYYKDYPLACCGIADKESGADEIHMFIEYSGSSSREKNLISKKLEGISKAAPAIYKIKKIHFLESLPRTAVGKIRRFQLIDEQENKVENFNFSTSITSTNNTIVSPDEFLLIIKKYCPDTEPKMSDSIKENLGMSSLVILEMILDLEKTYHKKIAIHLSKEPTVQELWDFICGKQQKETLDYNIEDFPREKDSSTIHSLNLWLKLLRAIYNIDIKGIENIPRSGNYLICSNHATYLDPLFLLAALNYSPKQLQKVGCMAAKHTMEGFSDKKISFAPKLFCALGGIPVDRQGNTLPAMMRAADCLKEGYNLILFPEGMFTHDGKILPFKPGAARLSIDTKKPMLPVRIQGNFEIFPYSIYFPRLFQWKKLRRYPVSIEFFAPIFPTSEESDDDFTKRIQDCIVGGGEK